MQLLYLVMFWNNSCYTFIQSKRLVLAWFKLLCGRGLLLIDIIIQRIHQLNFFYGSELCHLGGRQVSNISKQLYLIIKTVASQSYLSIIKPDSSYNSLRARFKIFWVLLEFNNFLCESNLLSEVTKFGVSPVLEVTQ